MTGRYRIRRPFRFVTVKLTPRERVALVATVGLFLSKRRWARRGTPLAAALQKLKRGRIATWGPR